MVILTKKIQDLFTVTMLYVCIIWQNKSDYLAKSRQMTLESFTYTDYLVNFLLLPYKGMFCTVHGYTITLFPASTKLLLLEV